MYSRAVVWPQVVLQNLVDFAIFLRVLGGVGFELVVAVERRSFMNPGLNLVEECLLR